MASNKRSNGEGNIRRLESGRWQGQVMDGYHDDGKKKTRSFSGATKKEVIEKIRDFHAQKENPVLTDNDFSFEDWATQWYESYQPQVEASTYYGYGFTLKLLNKHFGRMKLKDILPLHITSYINGLLKAGSSKSRIKKCRTMLIQIFDAAEDNYLVLRNPARKTKPIKDRAVAGFQLASREKDSFTDAEQELLFAQLNHDLLGHSIRLMLLTGLRVQELLALTAEDISEDGSVVNVDKAVKTVENKPMLGPPKSTRSIRKIPVPPAGRESALYLKNNARGPFIWSPSIIHPLYGVGSFRRRYYTAIECNTNGFVIDRKHIFGVDIIEDIANVFAPCITAWEQPVWQLPSAAAVGGEEK